MQEKQKSNEFLTIEEKTSFLITEKGFSLVDLDVLRQGKEITIVMYIHNKKRDIDSLVLLNDELYALLEKIDFLKDGFSLELSTPGIYRRFKFHKEFNIFQGEKVKILTKLNETHIGILLSEEDGVITVQKENDIITLAIKDIKRAGLHN